MAGIRDKKEQLGSLGGNVVDILVDQFESLGSDGSGAFTTVTATSVTASTFVGSSTTATPRVGMSNTDGVVSAISVVANASNSLSISGSGSTIAIAATTATGNFNLSMTANRADAMSITDGVGDLMVFDTSTGARVITIGGGVAADSVQVGGVSTAKIGFRAATPQSSVTYTITNDVTDRTFDANANSTLELADVVASLIRDLAAMGLLTVA